MLAKNKTKFHIESVTFTNWEPLKFSTLFGPDPHPQIYSAHLYLGGYCLESININTTRIRYWRPDEAED
jgi:hypothetical protein